MPAHQVDPFSTIDDFAVNQDQVNRRRMVKQASFFYNNIGVFTNSTLQELYDQLVADGRQSLADALRVGAAIEEIDILDLEEQIAQTDQADIQLVYDNLMKGSRNHLRSFTSTLEKQTGESYQPQYLDPEAYEAIVNAPMETGGSGQSQGQGRRSSR